MTEDTQTARADGRPYPEPFEWFDYAEVDRRLAATEPAPVTARRSPIAPYLEKLEKVWAEFQDEMKTPEP